MKKVGEIKFKSGNRVMVAIDKGAVVLTSHHIAAGETALRFRPEHADEIGEFLRRAADNYSRGLCTGNKVLMFRGVRRHR